MLELITDSEVLASLGVQYLLSKGIDIETSSDNQVKAEVCPLCKHDGGHFFLCYAGKKDGLFSCFRCQKTGNLRQLQELLGDKVQGVHSTKDWSSGANAKKIDALPDVDAAHAALLNDADAMDYLLNTRGFTQEIIEQQRIGLLEKHWFKSAGEVRALVIPYLVGDNCIFVKYRTLPPAPKDFNTPTGWDVPLFNGEILKPGLNEIIVTEGEFDACALLSHGINNVVGVPGASMKKAAWIAELDEVAPEKIYVMFDNDRAGSKGAQEWAQRIGIERCLKITLPELEYTEDGVAKKCKDINDFFARCGGTVEQFEKLKENAKQFDVSGVIGTKDGLQEFKSFLQGKTSLRPTYATPWPSLNKKVGFENGDVIDIMALEKCGKSTFALNILEHAVNTYGESGLFVCLEMSQMQLLSKWVSLITQTDCSIAKTDEEGAAKLQAMLSATDTAMNFAANREAELYFSYPSNVQEPEEIYNLIIQCHRRYGIGWAVIDNIQRLCDLTLAKMEHRTAHLSKISKKTSGLAKDLGLKLIRILQPHQIKVGEIIQSRNTDGSSQIDKDCDCKILLHRSSVGDTKMSTYESCGVIDTESALESRMLVKVPLSRYSGGGDCDLEFVGGTSTVRELTRDVRAAIPTRDPSLIRSTEVVKPLFKLPTAPRIATQVAPCAPELAEEITI